MPNIMLLSCFLMLMLVSNVVFSEIDHLSKARNLYVESERNCVVILEYYSYLNVSQHVFYDFVKNDLLLEDQVIIANCFEWVGHNRNYFSLIAESYVGEDIIKHLQRQAAERRGQGDLGKLRISPPHEIMTVVHD